MKDAAAVRGARTAAAAASIAADPPKRGKFFGRSLPSVNVFLVHRADSAAKVRVGRDWRPEPVADVAGSAGPVGGASFGSSAERADKGRI